MTIIITPESVRKGLKAIVESRGEGFVYSKRHLDNGYGGHCVYMFEGEPDCGVGQFLADAGVPKEELEEGDSGFGGMSADTLIGKLEEKGIIAVTSATATRALEKFQLHQDGGETWGQALAAALEQLDYHN